MENIDNIVELSHVGMQEYPENETGTFYIHGNYDQRGSKVNIGIMIIQIDQSDCLSYRLMTC